jgi:UDP-2,3-diacylglucosamine hydrolase
MQQYGVKTLIHGHTHRPAIHKLQLGDQAAGALCWGLGSSGWALQVDDQGFALAPFDFAPPPQLAAPAS